jgi:hypothetical protein
MRIDALFNSPRNHFSRTAKMEILDLLRACGVAGVPTLTAYQKFKEDLLEGVGNPTEQCDSDDGNIYFINRPSEALAKVSVAKL